MSNEKGKNIPEKYEEGLKDINISFHTLYKKEIPSNILYEDNNLMVIMDNNPVNNGHVLIIPKKHFEDYLALDDDTVQHMLKVAKELGPSLMQKVGASSLTLIVNYGDAQKVKHLHLHLIPNYEHRKQRF